MVVEKSLMRQISN